jgi:hypothetical protein
MKHVIRVRLVLEDDLLERVARTLKRVNPNLKWSLKEKKDHARERLTAECSKYLKSLLPTTS